MNVADQVVADEYALYLGDSMEVMAAMPAESIHLTVTSPPFGSEAGGLYKYTSSERDVANARDYDELMDHLGYFARELHRVTAPGRMAAYHVMDTPTGNSGGDALLDFPGDVIRMMRGHGWRYVARYHVWKEPLGVRNRTMRKDLAHKTLIDDSTRCAVASADYLLIFRRSGENPIPVAHPIGLMEYAGSRPIPVDVVRYRGMEGNQRENRYSQWIWRQYASAFWDDVRIERTLPFREARDEEDERHVHPLQLDVIDRALTLWSNPGEIVYDPFGGVGSTPYAAVRAGRFGVASEIKPSYWRQMVRNVGSALDEHMAETMPLFADASVLDARAELVGA